MKYFISIVFIFCSFTGLCQYQAVEKSMVDQGFRYPGFSKGSVLMKSGRLESTELNYNAFEQSMVYLADGKPMTITSLEDVDTVFLQYEKFISDGKKFYQLVGLTPLPLLISFEAKPLHKIATSDHLTTGKQDQNKVFNTVTDAYVTGKVREDVVYACIMIYWIKNGDKLDRANNEKQIAHLFGKKSDEILKYAHSHKTDFRIMEQVVDLVQFAQQ